MDAELLTRCSRSVGVLWRRRQAGRRFVLVLFAMALAGCPGKALTPIDTDTGNDTSCESVQPDVVCERTPFYACGTCDRVWRCAIYEDGTEDWFYFGYSCVCIEEDGTLDHDNPDCKTYEY